MIFLFVDPVALSYVRAKKRESSVFVPSRHLNCREDGAENKKQKREKETDNPIATNLLVHRQRGEGKHSYITGRERN